MAQKASRPRLSCTPRSVSISVATVCTHRLWVFTLVPVSSAWTTGEARSCSMMVSTKGSRRPPASCSGRVSQGLRRFGSSNAGAAARSGPLIAGLGLASRL
jgi:hypothetical protein